MRKSCDFCYLRKLKCDGQKPLCSHCIIYGTKCTYVAPSRPYKPNKSGKSIKSDEGSAELQDRIRRLETLVGRLAESSEEDEARMGVQVQVQPSGSTADTIIHAGVATDGRDADHKSTHPKSLHLPSKKQVLPLVHLFIERYNAVLPLFHDGALLQVFHDCYNTRPQYRDPVAWAAINVVLALAYRHGLAGAHNVKRSIEYLSNAQYVLSEVVLRDVQLLSVQVLVGMVILLQGSQDLQPSLILIATTMRLAHKIGLHNRSSSAHLNPVIARQHANVFWLAYILDKDLSLRAKQPSVQLDDDIDLDLPGVGVDQGRNYDVIASNDFTSNNSETVAMKYFLIRIQLAVIEGGVYDYLYSTRSQKRSPEERLHALESVADALEHWKASIPAEFLGSEALSIAPFEILPFLPTLRATHLLCTTCINEAHAWNARWVASLRKSSNEGTVLCLPPRWEALVEDARNVMILSGECGHKDQWNFW